MGLFIASLGTPLANRAAIVWTNTPIDFTNIAGSDPTLAANQDRMTSDVWITRGSSMGIYNAAIESAFTHFSSPTNTAWSDGTLDNYASLSYADWNTWSKVQHGGPRNTVGVPAVVHLISDDIYLSVTFTSWGGIGGGFSYVRTTPSQVDQPPTVSIVTPTNGASFTAPATIAITANASDPDGSVTNVSFFDGTSFLGQTNNTPYTVTITFGAGNHGLTAVATDNAGLSATSSVVNIAVLASMRLVARLVGNAIDLSWPVAAGHLQTQTNVLGANWIDVPNSTGTNHIIIPIDPANPNVFYRLTVP